MQQTTTVASSSSAVTVDQSESVPPPDEPAANEERHALKRTYLTLLPHTQLVELCLAFEAYSPLHVKKSLWPTNLAAAVAELQLGPAPPSSQDTTQRDITSGPVVNAPLTSVSSLPDVVTRSSPTGPSTAIDPHLPSDNANGDATAIRDESSSTQQPQTSDEPTSQPQPPTPSTTKPCATELPQGLYPHAPYGYTPTHSPSAYPHTPYYHYPPLSYPHNFPPQPSVPYPHASFPPSHPLFPPAVPLPRHPHPTGLPPTDRSGIPSDDLPSYEDMLVEALTDLDESDGSAPKALFSWMASRYPLHTNFRPSASQALQKAFKRGRLEKGSNGRYRLNASWDGGSTSRRTTRRPQSLAQMAQPVPHGPPTTSPFTHAPLPQPAARGAQGHNASTPTPASVQEKPLPYPHYPYHYPAGAPYPRYGPSGPPPVSKEDSAEQQSATAAAGEAVPVEGNVIDEVGEGSDAWEAAQAILKAINFGSLMQATTAKAAEPPVLQSSPPTNSIHVGSASDQATASETVTYANASPTSIQSLSERDRASLQAQLALLAAQLAEIAEDTLASDLMVADQDSLAEDSGTEAEEDDMEVVDIP